jgi:hypothetical protein
MDVFDAEKLLTSTTQTALDDQALLEYSGLWPSDRCGTAAYSSANACATVFVGMAPEGLRSRPHAFEFFVLLQTHANELTVVGFHTLSQSNADKQSKSQGRTRSQLDVHSVGHHRGLNRRTRDDDLQSDNPSM